MLLSLFLDIIDSEGQTWDEVRARKAIAQAKDRLQK